VRQASDIVAVDLFAGIGALSLGVTRAGARVAMAVEVDAVTATSYRTNNPDVVVLEDEISSEWHLAPNLNDQAIEPHLLVGGPPCRGWSTLGARSGEVRRDAYQACTWDFARLVHEIKPPAFLFENVNGLQHAKRGQILKALVRMLECRGQYVVSDALLRAADFGVPQLRQRVFIVGIRRDVGLTYEFPERTHDSETWVTVDDAIDDLPALSDGERATSYCTEPRTPYQHMLRQESDSLTWHEAPAAGETIKRVLAELDPGQDRSDLDSALRPSSGFHNTYGRMRGDAPASAVTGSIGRISSGRHAHPHQDRALTPREAARLQSIPDSYELSGQRWHVYRQIGDAVPPLLAEKVARPLIDLLGSVV
jgi:DNA (cytosine-5)-methyltransferase 1